MQLKKYWYFINNVVFIMCYNFWLAAYFSNIFFSCVFIICSAVTYVNFFIFHSQNISQKHLNLKIFFNFFFNFFFTFEEPVVKMTKQFALDSFTKLFQIYFPKMWDTLGFKRLFQSEIRFPSADTSIFEISGFFSIERYGIIPGSMRCGAPGYRVSGT